NLLILDGERLSYRTLDVEQIGSVYEAVMGLRLEIAAGRSIAIRLPKKNKGFRPPVMVDLDAILTLEPGGRGKALSDLTEYEYTGKVSNAVKSANRIEDLLAAIQSRIFQEVTPSVVPAGAMILQPTDERRKSGSHYTPRSLTEPIVRTTLRPILERL